MKISFPVRIYLIGLAARLLPVILTRGLGIGLDDMFQYDMLARSLASGNGFRWYAQEDLKLLEPYVDFDLSTVKDYDPQFGIYTSFRAPLYPAFLAVVYFFNGIGPARFFAARLAQAVFLGAPLAPLTYFISRRLFPQIEKTARVSACVIAFYPMLLVYPLGLGTENLFFILLLFSFLFLLRSVEQPTAFNLLFAGIFLALTSLTRSVILLFVGLSLGYLFFIYGRKAFFSAVAFTLIVTPWAVRNSLLHHKPAGIETSMGYNLYLGYHPAGNGSFVFGPSLDLLTILDDSARDEVGTQKAFEFMLGQPERLIPLAFNRLGFFFGLEKRVLMYFYSNNILGYIPRSVLISIALILLLPFVLVSLLAAFSLPVLHLDESTILLVMLLGAYLLPHVLILSEDRFHLALVPFLAMLAVQGRGLLFERDGWSGANKKMISISILLAFLLVMNWGFELSRDADKIAQLFGPHGNQTHFSY